MSQSNGSGRRGPKVLSPETKWEIFLQITSGEVTQADLARKWGVDVSTIITIRRTVKEAALAALSAKPGRPAKERDWRLEAAQAEIAELTLAVKSQAIELAVAKGKAGWGL
jgi:transposase-like protein